MSSFNNKSNASSPAKDNLRYSSIPLTDSQYQKGIFH